jgi:asparagine synthase (glutamine-hydrolysing)
VCGIAGVLRTDGGPADPEQAARMARTLAHRGPDGEGVWASGPIALGHRRLAIIDLSPAGRQPMSNARGTVWITFNGELYNFHQVRGELEARGYRFRSSTDTEVLLYAYEEWGTACLERFRGMFAFGLWDAERQSLWLVRDRLGVKPLFYTMLPRRILFGSEIKAILCDPEVERAIDYEALGLYLGLNYTPAPHSMFARVRQLLPGHWLMIDAGGRMEDREYWDLTFTEGPDRGEAWYREQLAAELDEAVRLRLVSDVPVGAFLSGGLDSSTVAYWMTRHMPEAVETFSVGFDEPSFDERPWARRAAAAIGSRHHERPITAEDAEVLPTLVWHAEEPTADSSMVALWHLSRLARTRVTVALSGDGADELLAGYQTYQAARAHRWFRRLPASLPWAITALVGALPISDRKVGLDARLRRFLAAAHLPSEDAHAMWRVIFTDEARRAVLAPAARDLAAKGDVVGLYRTAFARTNARDRLNRMLYVDTRLYLPNDMLVKLDRMSMAHGLEAREPYLDHRLVEFLATVPPVYKLRGLRHTKYLLKRLMDNRLPRSVVWRSKEGFNVPNARWIKQGLRGFVTDILSPDSVRDLGLLDPPAVDSVLRDHFQGRADNSHQIWCLLVLVLWFRRFVRNRT